MSGERDTVYRQRRRLIVIVGVILSVALAVLTAGQAKSSERASEDIVFLVSPTSLNPGSAGRVLNPYLGFNDLKVLVKAVTSLVESDSVKSLIKSQSGSDNYSFALSGDLTSPIATVSATASNSADALRTYTVVLAQVQQATRKLQQDAGAPASTWITANPVGTPSKTTALATPKYKAGAYGLGIGVIITLLALFLLSLRETQVRRRLQKQSAGAAGRPVQQQFPSGPGVAPGAATGPMGVMPPPHPAPGQPFDEGQFEYPVTADR